MKTTAFGGVSLAFAVLASMVSAQVVPHRCRVDLDLTPRPIEDSTRSADVNFDQSARLRVHLFALEKPTSEVKVQFLFFYDEVNSSGKVDRKVEAQEHAPRIAGAGDHAVASDPLRLTGKITKRGVLTGMRYIGYAARVYEGRRLVFETCQPPGLREEVAKEPGLVAEVRREPPPSREEAAPAEKPALPLPPPVPAAVAAPSPKPSPPAPSTADGEVVVMGFSFSPAEAKAALDAVNTLSVEDLGGKAGLSKTAAQHLVEARPIKSLDDLPKVKYVKTTAIAALKKYVSTSDGKR